MKDKKRFNNLKRFDNKNVIGGVFEENKRKINT